MMDETVYYCADCDLEFDEPKQWSEYRGEHFGTPAYETMYGCPICGGGFDVINRKEY